MKKLRTENRDSSIARKSVANSHAFGQMAGMESVYPPGLWESKGGRKCGYHRPIKI